MNFAGQGISDESEDGSIRVGTYSDNAFGAYIQTHSDHDLNFSTNNGAAQMTLKTDGNLGVGTTTPTSKFSVNGTADFSGKVGIGIPGPIPGSEFFNVSSESGSGFRVFNFAGSLVATFVNEGSQDGASVRYAGLPGDDFWDVGQTADNDFRISRGPGGINSPLIVKAGGNVGIGTLDPNNKLHVEGGARISGGYMQLCTTPDNTSGNVGIGSNGFNDTKLDVTSNQAWGMYVDNANAEQFAFYVNGEAAKPGGSSWVVASDARLKNDVNPYSEGLDQILQINPVKFRYNERSGFNSEVEHVGVIAQELQEVAPYMVGTFKNRTDQQEYLDVNDGAMTYMLINAIKEQQVQIETQKAENESLQSQIDELRQMIIQLQNK